MIQAPFLKALERIVRSEIELYDTLMKATSEEYAAVIRMDLSRLANASREREALVLEAQRQESERRALVVEQLGEGTTSLHQRLSEAPLSAGVSPRERARVISLLRELRTRVVEVRRLSLELQSISVFCLEVANGCMSLFQVGKQVRNRVYSARGRLSDSMTPRYCRSELTIREA